MAETVVNSLGIGYRDLAPGLLRDRTLPQAQIGSLFYDPKAGRGIRWLLRLEETPWDDLLEDDEFPATSALPGYDSVAARVAARATVVHNAESVFELYVPGLTPEGTAWDPRRKELLFSSGHLRKVIAVDRRGRVRDVTTSAQDGLMRCSGCTSMDETVSGSRLPPRGS